MMLRFAAAVVAAAALCAPAGAQTRAMEYTDRASSSGGSTVR